jgi:hypothetical protein
VGAGGEFPLRDKKRSLVALIPIKKGYSCDKWPFLYRLHLKEVKLMPFA